MGLIRQGEENGVGSESSRSKINENPTRETETAGRTVERNYKFSKESLARFIVLEQCVERWALFSLSFSMSKSKTFHL